MRERGVVVLHRGALLLVDVALVFWATLFAAVIRSNFELRLEDLPPLFPYTAISCGMVLVLGFAFGLNRSIWRMSAMSDYLRVVVVAALIVTSSVLIGFLMSRMENVARALPLLQFMLMVFLMVGARVAARLRYTKRSDRGLTAKPLSEASLLTDNVLIVGVNRLADLYIRAVAELGDGHPRIAGILVPKSEQVGRTVGDVEIVGEPENVAQIVRNLEVHGVSISRIVVLVDRRALSAAARDALVALEKESEIELQFFGEAIGFGQKKTSGRAAEEVQEPLDIGDVRAALSRPYWRAKRIFDIGLAAALIIVLSPVMLLIAALVGLVLGFPVIFWQQRPGQGARPFRVFKFRTMGPAHDTSGDRVPDVERHSLVGSVLRRLRLDELPQLFNILVGEMSFIGPRPLLPVDLYPALSARLLVRPGLTGWAQVHGGRVISAADKAALDMWYVKNASFSVDVRIALQTLHMLIMGERTSAEAIERAWKELRPRPAAPAIARHAA